MSDEQIHPPAQPAQSAPPATGQGGQKPPGIGLKIFYVLLILGFGAAGVGAFLAFFNARSEAAALKEDGVETQAEVTSVVTTTSDGEVTHNEVSVRFDPEGPETIASATLIDCSAQRWEDGVRTMDIAYLPDDRDVIGFSECAKSPDVLSAVLGTIFLAIALFLLWRAPGFLRR
jgi:hypothetical protein